MASRYRANRRRTAGLFATIAPEAYEDRPLPLRHPFVFYDGHIPAFSFYTLVRDALHRPSVDPALEKLFDRGIDPRDVSAAATMQRSGFPDRAVVQAFGAACDAAVLDAYANARLDDPSNPNLVHAQAAWNILEHEEMHHETLSYIIHRLARDKQRGLKAEHRDVAPPQRDPIAIPAGRATLGARRDAIPFGWDNEFDEHVVDVGAFGIDAYDVTNGEYLAFVRDGGPVPTNWFEQDGAWMLRAMFDDLPLPLSWPVWCTQEQATAFARWSGARLMTEPEYHRAAYGTPSGDERAQPWGDDAPDPAAARQLRLAPLRSRTGRLVTARRERVRRARPRRQRLGVDGDAVRPVRRLRADGVLPALLRGLLRRHALRDERRRPGDGVDARATLVPQLVLLRLPVHGRVVQTRVRLVEARASARTL